VNGVIPFAMELVLFNSENFRGLPALPGWIAMKALEDAVCR
jgi:hypothetical protein